MPIPTEPIGSVPRTPEHVAAMGKNAAGELSDEVLADLTNAAVKDTVAALEEAVDDASCVISDGEQSKPSFATYPIHSLKYLAGGGVAIPFEDGHSRQLPTISEGPFAYAAYASQYLAAAKKVASPGRKIKQAVISASAMSLLYPADGIEGYSKEEFLDDVVKCAVRDVRECLDLGADSVQMDFTEARLSLKLDPSGGLLAQFVDLNNRVFEAFPDEADAARLGIHICPGADQDACHSADVDYERVLPTVFRLRVRRFYMQLKSEKDPSKVLACVKECLKPGQMVFVGVTDVNDPRIETPEEICELVKLAATFIPLEQLGTCDDCGFSPFADDLSTSRDIAFAKIKARVAGTKMASEALGF